MNWEDWQTTGYVIGGIVAAVGSALTAIKLQRTMRSSPVWDNGDKLGMRDAVRRLVQERDVISARLVKLEVRTDQIPAILEAVERQGVQIAALERAVRALLAS
jgi:hypothetical protein